MTVKRVSTREKFHAKTQEYALTWWPVYVLLIPVIAALAVYWNHPGEKDAEIILLFASIVVGMEIVLIAIKHLKENVETSIFHWRSSGEASSRLLQTVLSTPDFSGIRGLLDVMFAIQHRGNPLMKRLADDQVSDLAAFLKNFDKTLPFIRGEELITIERHYTSFMQAIGKGGAYVATTLPSFWIEGDGDILQTFFHSQEVSASNGIHIYRVFLLTKEDRNDPRVVALLRKHFSISGEYRNGGSIETKILEVRNINPKEDDFGIYLLDDEPAAVAIARFTRNGLGGLRLQGNDVSFDIATMESRLNLFRSRFESERAVPISEYLRAFPSEDAAD